MSQSRKNVLISCTVVLLVLITDQIVKYLVKTNMTLHQSIVMANDWAYLFFTENKGMAFGMDFFGTVVLCSFRIIAIAFIIYYLNRLIRMQVSVGFVICVSLVLAGAAGNIFDNLFYGLIYTESTDFSVATLVPIGEGYGGLLSGKVVDMFYFPIIDTILPDWIPLKGGERFIFFSPIFNVADSAITCGGLSVVFFYHNTFAKVFGSKAENEDVSP